MHVHAEHVVTRPVDGAYEEVWMAPDKWRREISFPGFTQTEVGDTDSKWLIRNSQFRPRAVYLTAIAVEAFLSPHLQFEEKIASVRTRKIKGIEARCVELLGKERAHGRDLCFDATGLLLMESTRNKRFEYADFDKFNGKFFPKSIRVYEDDSKVLEITADDLGAPHEPQPEMFQHQPDARQMAPCELWPADATKKIPPEYPPAARNIHQQGTVTLYALLSGDGTVSKTSVLTSASSTLDQSAVDAVKQWLFPPAACGAIPLNSEVEIQINYQLR